VLAVRVGALVTQMARLLWACPGSDGSPLR
jgi:hypothetical protein